MKHGNVETVPLLPLRFLCFQIILSYIPITHTTCLVDIHQASISLAVLGIVSHLTVLSSWRSKRKLRNHPIIVCPYCFDYFAVYPPSTGMFAPVIYKDASDARKTTIPIRSVSFAILPRNVLFEYLSINSSG